MSSPIRIALRAGVVAATLLAPALAAAQGNLSTQGLGFPQGQLSTRALSTGGALAETDPVSPLNPASLLGLGAATLYFQAEPEFRRVSIGSASDYTVTGRYPLALAAVPVGQRWMLGLSASSLLDRTWSVSRTRTDTVRGEEVKNVSTLRSDGSISDLRLALAFMPRPWLRVGLGGHLFSGSDRLFGDREFPDSTRYSLVRDTTDLSFSGGAVSGGVIVIIPRVATLALSARRGGDFRASRGDTTIARGDIPDRFGFSAAYIGIANTTISARAALDKWSSLGSTVSASSRPADTWDTGLGADVAGPRLGGLPLQLRAGVRRRTLPFPVFEQTSPTTGVRHEVKESSISFGTGTFLAQGRVAAELAAVRSSRSAGIGVSERAWTISVGVTVRP